jgi:bacterioferritin-associated ferredoxin
VAGTEKPPRVSQMYACLGCKVQCGRCARAIRRIIDEAPAGDNSRSRRST